MSDIGNKMYALAHELYPICRSLTGEGVRTSLNIIKNEIGELNLHEVASGTRALDWTVPNEWNIRDAYCIAPNGEKVIDFKLSNLSVVGYSTPVNTTLSLAELEKHLHSLPDQPEAIPYITSYYKPYWGFCLPHRDRVALPEGQYTVVIDSELKPGKLNYAECYLPGESKEEIFISTYICHPSMGNNEVSGPVVTTFLAAWLKTLPTRRYSYRIVFAPETIGAIVYISKNLSSLKNKVVNAFNVTCVGDERSYSLLPSRLGNTLTDKVARHVLKHIYPDYIEYPFSMRGSDERQYCSPKLDLPMVSIMRSKYAEYPEYHTSLDNLDLISPAGLAGSFNALKTCIECLENNATYELTCIGEPQLGKRGLYPNLSQRNIHKSLNVIKGLLAYCDGKHDLLSIAELIGEPMSLVVEQARKFVAADLLAQKATTHAKSDRDTILEAI